MNGSLEGQSIVITRDSSAIESTAETIRRRGGIPIACPMILIHPPKDTQALDEAIRRLSQFDWIFFTSANSVRYFWKRLIELDYAPIIPEPVQCAVIGPATRCELEAHGVQPAFAAERFTGASFFEEFTRRFSINDRKIFLPLSNIAHRTLPGLLNKHGANVTEAVTYCNDPARQIPDDVLRQIKEKEIDWVLFTSSSTACNFCNLFAKTPQLKTHFRAASIGPSTSATLREHGIEPAVEAETHTIDGLLDAIAAHS